MHRSCVSSAEEDNTAALDTELVPKVVCVHFGTVMQLSTHTETRVLVVENETDQDIVLGVEQSIDDRTPMTTTSKRLRVSSRRRAEMGFVLNTSLQEGSHSFGFRVEIQGGISRGLRADYGRTRTDVLAKVEVRRPSVRLQAKNIRLGPVAVGTGKVEKDLQLFNDGDVPVRIKTAVQQDSEFAVEVTVKPANKLLRPHEATTLVVQIDTNSVKGKLIDSTIVVAVGSSDNLLRCSCTGSLVESCPTLGLIPRAAEQDRDEELKMSLEKGHGIGENAPLFAIDVAECGRTQFVNGSDGQPLFSVQCSSIYFCPGSREVTVQVQSQRQTEHVQCWGETRSLEGFVSLRCLPPTPFYLGPMEHGKLTVNTCEPLADCAGIGGTFIISGVCTTNGRDVTTRAVIPIGGALFPREIRLPDVEVGKTTSAALFLANHSVANMPFRLDVPVRKYLNGRRHGLQIEPDAGSLAPGEMTRLDVAYQSHPDQSAEDVSLQIAAKIGGCHEINVPVRVRAGRTAFAIENTMPSQIQLDLSKVHKYCSQGDKPSLKPQEFSARVKNVGDITAALTKIEGDGMTIADLAHAQCEIQPDEERHLRIHVSLGSLVDIKREFTLHFGPFGLGCSIKMKIDGPNLGFKRSFAERGPKSIQTFQLGVVEDQLASGIGFFVVNRGTKKLRYRLVDAIVMMGGAVETQVTLGNPTVEDSTKTRELAKKGSDEWFLHVDGLIGGPIGIIVVFEAENQPTLAPDGEVLPTSRHSLLFTGYANLAKIPPELCQHLCGSPHDLGFGVSPMVFVRLATDTRKTLEARALGMPLAACSVACGSNESKELDEEPEDEVAAKILALDISVIQAVLGGAGLDPDGATLAAAIKSATTARVQASAVALAEAVLHEFAAHHTRRSLLFDLAMKLMQDNTSREEGLEACEHFLSLDVCRFRPKGKVCHVGTPTLLCWIKFRALATSSSSSATSRVDLGSRAICVLSVGSTAALLLQPFVEGFAESQPDRG